MEVYGLPQPLTGSELVTIRQEQNGHLALCSMPLSVFATYLSATSGSTTWATTLPTARPSTSGVVWNNGGVVSIS